MSYITNSTTIIIWIDKGTQVKYTIRKSKCKKKTCKRII